MGTMSNPDEIISSISCVDCIDALFHCFGPAHQFDRYYKDGKLDECDKQIKDLKFCIKIKSASKDQTKTLLKELVSDTKQSTSIGSVWEARGKLEK